MNYNYIVIEGNIGAGKTTLSHKLAEQFNARLILEKFEDNPFLPKFYKDPDRYSFPLELSFLADRYNQMKSDLHDRELFQTMVVSDYYFMKCLIFSRANLQEDEFNLYRQLFNIIYSTLPKPDLYIYLYVSIDNLLRNINKRGRDYEKEIKPEYLERIQEGYFEFFKQETDVRFLVIDVNQVNFAERDEDYLKIVELITKNDYPLGINRIIL